MKRKVGCIWTSLDMEGGGFEGGCVWGMLMNGGFWGVC